MLNCLTIAYAICVRDPLLISHRCISHQQREQPLRTVFESYVFALYRFNHIYIGYLRPGDSSRAYRPSGRTSYHRIRYSRLSLHDPIRRRAAEARCFRYTILSRQRVSDAGAAIKREAPYGNKREKFGPARARDDWEGGARSKNPVNRHFLVSYEIGPGSALNVRVARLPPFKPPHALATPSRLRLYEARGRPWCADRQGSLDTPLQNRRQG